MDTERMIDQRLKQLLEITLSDLGSRNDEIAIRIAERDIIRTHIHELQAIIESSEASIYD